jgi:hypothetical protein
MIALPKQAQTFEPFVHSGQGSIERTVEIGGDIAKTFAFVDSLPDHFPLSRGEVVQQLAKLLFFFALFGLKQRTEAGVAHYFFPAVGSRERGCGRGLILLFPLAKHGLVVGDGEQPAAEMSGIDSLKPFQGPAPGFLEGIFRGVMVSKDANQELKQWGFIAHEQRLQGTRFSRAKTGDQVSIRGGSVILARTW